jgi:hypothetical protein
MKPWQLLTTLKPIWSKAMSSPTQDFAPLPQYSQTTTKNESWVNVTLTRSNPDGSKSQVATILPKAK